MNLCSYRLMHLRFDPGRLFMLLRNINLCNNNDNDNDNDKVNDNDNDNNNNEPNFQFG